MSNNIYENNNYFIRLGNVYDVDRKVEIEGYHVVNKNTGVCEYEAVIYPQAISFAEDASDHLARLCSTDKKDAASLRIN